MRIITWNVHRANENSKVWNFLLDLNPDIVLLQEVGSVPKNVQEKFDSLSRPAIYKTGKQQKFSTVVLVNGEIIKEIKLKSKNEFVNKELEFFKGNFIVCQVKLQNHNKFNVVSVYSPAWNISEDRIKGFDISEVRLKSNSKIWASEIIWYALKETINKDEIWIVGGDYNSSETFDSNYQKEHGLERGIVEEGNREIRERMYKLGFKECLLEYKKELTPTYKHTDNKIIHQLDHLYATDSLFGKIIKADVGNQSKIFNESLSDHLPIIADFT